MEPLHDARKNRLLAALPPDVWDRWAHLLESLSLPSGSVLHEAGRNMTHVYFPTDALVSLLYVVEEGSSAEVALVGKEGLVGLAVLLEGNATPTRAVVQSAGACYRMRAAHACAEFDSSPAVRRLLLRYTQAFITQVAQTAVCNRHHTLDQQLCRWLLMSLDALGGTSVAMTQELIANVLGVRRGGVTHAALKLQEAGVIRYKRGHIDVLDRSGLERRACECYAVVKKEYQRLLLPVMPGQRALADEAP